MFAPQASLLQRAKVKLATRKGNPQHVSKTQAAELRFALGSPLLKGCPAIEVLSNLFILNKLGDSPRFLKEAGLLNEVALA
jgi:hypothetical protein